MTFHPAEKYRLRSGEMRSDQSFGANGFFIVPAGQGRRKLIIQISDGEGWEHVSVHARGTNGKQSTPNWDEMCFVKDLFWDEEDCCVQYHPRRSQYVSNHPHTLHIWRPNRPGLTVPEPHQTLVGLPQLGDLSKLSPEERKRVSNAAMSAMMRGEYDDRPEEQKELGRPPYE